MNIMKIGLFGAGGAILAGRLGFPPTIGGAVGGFVGAGGSIMNRAIGAGIGYVEGALIPNTIGGVTLY